MYFKTVEQNCCSSEKIYWPLFVRNKTKGCQYNGLAFIDITNFFVVSAVISTALKNIFTAL